jgi:hypothetical protein
MLMQANASFRWRTSNDCLYLGWGHFMSAIVMTEIDPKATLLPWLRI